MEDILREKDNNLQEKAKEADQLDTKLVENIMEISGVFTEMALAGKIAEPSIGVSAWEVFRDQCRHWAEQFEELYARDFIEDYPAAIREYAMQCLKKEGLVKQEVPLTAGLLRNLLKSYNCPELERFLEGREDDCRLDLLNRDDYIAMKIWSRNDIASCLEEKGYPVTEENIDRVIDSGELKGLDFCSDGDWEIIYQAIKRHAKE